MQDPRKDCYKSFSLWAWACSFPFPLGEPEGLISV